MEVQKASSTKDDGIDIMKKSTTAYRNQFATF